MKAEIITIGDELMAGDVVDTNFSWLAQRLWRAGYELEWHSSVPDQAELMAETFRRALRSDLVIVTGGLGPTSDDKTLEVAAATFGRALVCDETVLATITERLKKLGRALNEFQAKQALYPEGGRTLPNPRGTAPACYLKQDNTHFIFLMGVPRELYAVWEEAVWPLLQGLPEQPRPFAQKVFRTFGSAEGDLQKKLKDFAVPDVRLSYRLKFPEVLLKLACWQDTQAAVDAAMDEAERLLHAQIGEHIYAVSEEPLEKLIGEQLVAKQATLAVAESCTGGYLANLLTDVPGSSRYFLEGLVTYANDAKQDLLGVPAELLATHGAVSAETAIAMALGLRKRSGATYTLALTGIAGPSGGTAEKPVGTVFIALAGPEGVNAKHYHFAYGRDVFKSMAAHVALHKLRQALTSASASNASHLTA